MHHFTARQLVMLLEILLQRFVKRLRKLRASVEAGPAPEQVASRRRRACADNR